MSVVDRLKAKSGFTATESEVADWMLHHAEELPHMTIGELSEATHASKAVIIRLCKKMGLEGYRDLRVEMATDLERRRAHLSGIDASRPFTVRESCATVMRSLALLERDAAEACYRTISSTTVEEVARKIMDASHLVLYARGNTCLVGELFCNMLAKLGIHYTNAGLYGNYYTSISRAKRGEVALFLSYSGDLLRQDFYVRGRELLRARGCIVVVITALDADNPLLAGADYVLSYPKDESEIGAIGGFYSEACMRYILNCLYARVYALDFATHDAEKSEAETWWR